MKLGIFFPYLPILWCDNIGSSTNLSVNPMFHARTYIACCHRLSFCLQKVAHGDLLVKFIFGREESVNILTKPRFYC
jgi:hypothetical protein